MFSGFRNGRFILGYGFWCWYCVCNYCVFGVEMYRKYRNVGFWIRDYGRVEWRVREEREGREGMLEEAGLDSGIEESRESSWG